MRNWLIALLLLVLFGMVFQKVWELEGSESLSVMAPIAQQEDLAPRVEEEAMPLDSLSFTSIFDYRFQVQEPARGAQLQVHYKDEALAALDYPQGIMAISSSDLNYDAQPELFVLSQGRGQATIDFYTYQGAVRKKHRFPPLRGRQAFGYAGKDCIFIAGSALVRQFRFQSDPFAEMPSGYRQCHYRLGPNNAFLLIKTLDFEKDPLLAKSQTKEP